MLKKILIVSAVLLFHFTTVAQNIEGVNARLDAIAGSGAIDDIGWTIAHPASIYKFANQFQGTICLMDIPGVGKTFGPIIGIVGFNDYLYAGVTLNNRMMMPAVWYSEGALILETPHLNGEENAARFPNLPHINLCLKINDNLKFGVGGFIESSSYSKKETKILQYVPQDTEAFGDIVTVEYNHEHDNKTVRNPGFFAEARITLGPLTMNPQFRVGFPKISGAETSNQLKKVSSRLAQAPSASPLTDSLSDISFEWDSPEGSHLTGGSHFWTDIGNTFFITGLFYTNKHYQFNKHVDLEQFFLNVDGTIDSTKPIINNDFDSIPSDRNWQSIDYWFAFIPSFSDNLYFSPEYDGGIEWQTGKDPNIPADTSFIYVYHNFRLGMENIIENVWIFDEFIPRCGISAQWNKEDRYVEDFDDETSESDESIPWKSFFWGSDFTNKEAKITGGFGLKKGRGTFDISCDFLKWQGQGVISGPAAAMATLTIDFSRKKEF